MKKILLTSILLLLTPFIVTGAVVINEIAWMGTENSSSDEWIELYNTDNQQVDLSGWILEAADSAPIINLRGSIPANGYFLLERTDDQTVSNIAADQIYTGALGNTGEYLKLKDNDGNIINEIDCSEEWLAGNNSTKQTIERATDGWKTSLNSGGTPKALNSSGMEPEEPKEPGDEPNPPASEAGTPPTPPAGDSNNQPASPAGGPPIADAGNNIAVFTDEEITFDGSKSYDPDNNKLIYSWNLGEGILKEGILVVHKYPYPGTYLVTLMVYDGKYSNEDTITVKIYSDKITVNEFLPNPIGKDAGDEENPGEWIEIYNDSNQIIDIDGWQLDDEEGGSKPFIFPENTLIAPKGFLIFSRQVTGIALNNDGDEVRFLLPTGVIFQKIIYEKAPEGQSSARTAEGFIWSTPTPGILNNKPLKPEIISSPPKDTTLYNKSGSENSTKDSQAHEQSKSTKENQQYYYDLANLEGSPGNNNKLVLIVITIAIAVFAIGIVILKFRKKS